MTLSNVIRAVVVLALIGGAAFVTTAAVNRQDSPAAQEVADEAVVELGRVAVEVEANGSVQAAREVPLSFGTAYTVAEVFVREGDSVQAGDVIARLDTTDLDLLLASRENNVAAAENRFDAVVNPPRDVDLDAALAALDAAEAAQYAAWMARPSEEEIEIARLEVELARNRVWQTQLERDLLFDIPPEFRARSNPNTPVYSQEIQVLDGLNQANTGVDIAETQLDRIQGQGPNESAFGSAVEAITQAEIALDNLLNPDERDVELLALNIHNAALGYESAAVQMSDFEIIAPFDGTVITSNLEVGELPPANMPAVVLADTTTFTVEIEVDETDVINMRYGLPVVMDVDALPEAEITGIITHIDLLPIPQEPVPTYIATITLDPTLAPVRSGMSTTATILVDELSDVAVIPTRFIDFTEAGAFVTVIDQGVPQRVQVVTGREDNGMTQIISGLNPGQRVVLLNEVEGGLLSRFGQ